MSLSFVSGSPAWTAAGWAMVHSLWIGAAIGVVGAALRRLLRSARPEWRYGASLACLAAMTMAPGAAYLRVYEPVESPRPAAVPAPAIVVHAAGHTSLASLRPPRIVPPPILPSESTAMAHVSRLESLVAWLPAVWIAGSSLTLATLGLGLVGLRRMRRSSRILFEGDIPRRGRLLAESLGIARGFRIAVCDRLSSPVLMGILRPMILLPPSAVTGWGMDHLEMALLHELAHLRRHDNLVNLFQCVAESLLFFHPAAWWLSAWVRLERESCCDRLVIERTGRSHAYAEMLASLATSRGTFSTASAMAERPVITRIRRILNGEDRPMRLTVPEGFGLISAALVAASLALGAHANPAGKEPEAGPGESTRKALREAAEKASAVKFVGLDFGMRGQALLDIASAQIAVGDRGAARETMRRVEESTAGDVSRFGVPADMAAVQTLMMAAEVWRKAGDLDSARATLARAEASLPKLDDSAARLVFDLKVKALALVEGGAALIEGGSGPDVASAPAIYLIEMSAGLVEARLALGDLAEARDLCRRAAAVAGSVKGKERPLLISALGAYLVRAGDREAGLERIEEGRRDASALPEEDRDRALPYVARAWAEIGDLDAAFALIGTLAPTAQRAAVREVLETVTTHDPRSGFGWFDPAGIKILIGSCGLMPEDSDAARTGLAELATRVGAVGDVKLRARSLSMIAELQAQAGDLPGASRTARSIPALRRRDCPGPRDGFYDAVKPATIAKVAARMAKAGDPAGASTLLDEAAGLARAIEDDDQKMIAQIVLAESSLDAGDPARALAVIAEAVPPAKAQPEPRRSRGLALLAACQARAGDADGAMPTIDSIRDYPGLEKARGLSAVAAVREKAGDPASAKALRRRAIAYLEADAPEGVRLGATMKNRGIAQLSFVDYDLECEPAILAFFRKQTASSDRDRLGEPDESGRAGHTPDASRDFTLSQRVSQVARDGDLAGALRLADTIGDAKQKLAAYQLLALAVRDGRATR